MPVLFPVPSTISMILNSSSIKFFNFNRFLLLLFSYGELGILIIIPSNPLDTNESCHSSTSFSELIFIVITKVILEFFPIKSHEEVIKHNDYFVSKGYEGVILRVPNSVYENKRSKNLLKYKTFIDDEFKIIDIVEGTGNRTGMAGNLTLQMNNGKIFNAGIRGGEDYYKQLLIDKNKYIGKLATVRYQNLSVDGIPRFPVAVNIAPIDR